MTRLISKDQLKALHTILGVRGLMNQKASLIAGITNDRTESSRELTFNEALDLIHSLNDDNTVKPGDRMRKKILGICHDLGWYIPKTRKLDFKKIDTFLLSKHGTGKKLNAMNEAELNKAVGMFQGLRNSHLKNSTKFEADGTQKGSE